MRRTITDLAEAAPPVEVTRRTVALATVTLAAFALTALFAPSALADDPASEAEVRVLGERSPSGVDTTTVTSSDLAHVPNAALLKLRSARLSLTLLYWPGPPASEVRAHGA